MQISYILTEWFFYEKIENLEQNGVKNRVKKRISYILTELYFGYLWQNLQKWVKKRSKLRNIKFRNKCTKTRA